MTRAIAAAAAAAAVIAVVLPDTDGTVPSPSTSSERLQLAYQAWRGDWEIHVARPDGSGRRQLTRNRFDDRFPSWSPSGRHLVFVRSGVPGELATRFVMRADGGGVWRLGRSVSAYEWSPDGSSIAFTEKRGSPLSVANADGSDRTLVFRGEPHGFEWSPNGTAIAFGCGSDLCVAGATGWGFQRLVRNARNPDWSPDGLHIAFLRPLKRGSERHGVYVCRADGTRAQRVFPVSVSSDGKRWSWSPDGRTLAIAEGRIGVVDADGTGFKWIGDGRSVFSFAWSPEGRRIAFDCGPSNDVCVADVVAGVARNLTSSTDRIESGGAWSPDGKRIALLGYHKDIDDEQGIFVVGAGGGGPVRITELYGSPSWSPDGRWVSFWTHTDVSRVWVVRSDGSRLTRIARQALREAWRPQSRR